MTTPRVTVPVEPTPLSVCHAIAPYLGATDQNDWSGLKDDDSISMPVKMRVGDLRALKSVLSAAPAPEGGAVDNPGGYLVKSFVEGWYWTPNADLDHVSVAPVWSVSDNRYETDPPALATREEAPAEAGERTDIARAIRRAVGDAWIGEHQAEVAADAILTLRAQPPARDVAYQDAHDTAVELGYPSLTEALEDLEGLKQAREGAQPVAWAIFWRHAMTLHPTLEAAETARKGVPHDIAPLYTHPAPEALRVANLWWSAEDWEATFDNVEDAYDAATGGEMRGVAKLGCATEHNPRWAVRIDYDTTGDGEADDYEIRLFKSVEDAHAYLAALQAEQKGGA